MGGVSTFLIGRYLCLCVPFGPIRKIARPLTRVCAVLRLDEPGPVFKGFLVGRAHLIVQHSSLSLDRLFWAESSLRSFSFNEDDSAQNNQRRSKLMMEA
jgi:hypothetical protein